MQLHEKSVGFLNHLSNDYFTITAEILSRSLDNFYRQYADRHMNLKFVRHKQIDVSF